MAKKDPTPEESKLVEAYFQQQADTFESSPEDSDDEAAPREPAEPDSSKPLDETNSAYASTNASTSASTSASTFVPAAELRIVPKNLKMEEQTQA